MTGERECATGQPRSPAMPKSCSDLPFRCFARWPLLRRPTPAASVAMTSCLPFTTLVMKLSRSRSPFLSKLTSIRMPGYCFTDQLDPMHGIGKRLRIELADLLGDRLDDIHSRVALQGVVVGLVVVFLLELGGEGPDARIRRVRGEADMRDGAVRGVAGELDHLLAGEHRLADDRLVVALLAQLAQRARRLLPRWCRRTTRRRSPASP